MNFKYKNSSKNDFALNLLIVLIAAIFLFLGAKIFEGKASIVIYALAIAVSYCRIAVEAIEKLISKKFHSSIVSTVAILVIFASQNFIASAAVAVVYSLCKAVYDLICSCFSDKLIEDDENKLKYEVIRDDEFKTVFADELCEGDVVNVVRGDYLAFDYISKNEKGEDKSFKAGKYSALNEAQVSVVEPALYEIDFFESVEDEKSKSARIAKIITAVYTVAAVVIAIAMFAMKLINGATLFEAFYILGVYLLFANPLSCDSGIVMSGLFSIKNLKNKGIYLKNSCDVEKLSRVKKIFFKKSAVLNGEDKINENAVKAVKIADVLKIETELLHDGDEQNCSVVAKACDFKQYQFGCDEGKTNEVIAEQVIRGAVAYVSDSGGEQAKNVLTLSTENNADIRVNKTALSELVKAVKTTKLYKWFVLGRAAVGAAINFLVIAFYASGIGDKFFSDKLIEMDMSVAGTDAGSLMSKIAKCLLYNDMMAPWIIGLVHLCVINLFIFVTICFLNINKKLR